MTEPLRVLVVTDSFPPGCGGSGWSTWELVRGLLDRGHRIDIVHVRAGARTGVMRSSYEGVPVTVLEQRAPAVPYLRNVVKNEWLWRRLTSYLIDAHLRQPVDVVHAQHVLGTVPAVDAARRARVPVVATVRDYWPVCYWSDLIHDPSQSSLCPGCTAAMMTRCIRPRSGAGWPLALPMIPYMRANLRTKRQRLSAADAVIAVSSTIARDLSSRVPDIDRGRIHTIPNPFDMAALDEAFALAEPPMPGPYVLYAGKLAVNKGVQYLLPALAKARISWPLVVLGDGPMRAEFEARARQMGQDVRVLGWVSRNEVWVWMQHASILAFPSYGPESLSRVLIEAAAMGAPIAAMDTGGTKDIITHDVTGLLSTDADGFARDLRRLADDPALCASLGTRARADVHARFASPSVVRRIEAVYRSVLRPEAGAR